MTKPLLLGLFVVVLMNISQTNGKCCNDRILVKYECTKAQKNVSHSWSDGYWGIVAKTGACNVYICKDGKPTKRWTGNCGVNCNIVGCYCDSCIKNDEKSLYRGFYRGFELFKINYGIVNATIKKID